jgi:hypothetical protein
MATVKATADTGTINYKDLLKGLAMAVISAVLTTVYSAIDTGGLETVNWKTVLTVASVSAIGYLIKNLFTPAQIVVENPSQSLVQSVKSGESEVKVVQK